MNPVLPKDTENIVKTKLSEESTQDTVTDNSDTGNTNRSDPAASQGTKKVLTSTRGLLERLSKLLVKLVHKIFPWNRRARNRVYGDGAEEDL